MLHTYANMQRYPRQNALNLQGSKIRALLVRQKIEPKEGGKGKKFSESTALYYCQILGTTNVTGSGVSPALPKGQQGKRLTARSSRERATAVLWRAGDRRSP